MKYNSRLGLVENWNDILDRMSKVIRDTEIQMRSRGLSISVELDGLSWRNHGKGMRICFESKPLIEHTCEVRADNFDKIPKLVNAADEAMAKKFGHVRDSQIGV